MYLRFYSQMKENIDKCIEELKPLLHGITGIHFEPITLSVNQHLPPETDTLKNVQVVLTFNTADEEKAAYQNKEGLAIYKKYMNMIHPGATVEICDAGQPVFQFKH